MEEEDLDNLTCAQIRQKLLDLGQTIGPVTARTRNVHLKKLKSLLLQKQSPQKYFDKFDPKNIPSGSNDANGSIRSNRRSQQTPPRKRKNIELENEDERRPSYPDSMECDVYPASEVDTSSQEEPGRRRKMSRVLNSPNMESPNRSSLVQAQKRRSQPTYESPTPDASHFDDECQDFGNLIAKKIRKYDDLLRSIIQNEITSIFIKADTGYYDRH